VAARFKHTPRVQVVPPDPTAIHTIESIILEVLLLILSDSLVVLVEHDAIVEHLLQSILVAHDMMSFTIEKRCGALKERFRLISSEFIATIY